MAVDRVRRGQISHMLPLLPHPLQAAWRGAVLHRKLDPGAVFCHGEAEMNR